MKNLIKIQSIVCTAFFAFAIQSCSTTRLGVTDDVYSDISTKAPTMNTQYKQRNDSDPVLENKNPTTTEEDGDYIEKKSTYTNSSLTSSYDEYDYYDDYMYSSRIRRFYSPYSGFGFYSSPYTNYYYYNNNPNFWGSSIYSNGWGYDPYYRSWSYSS